jgi:hypothetical protein
MKTETITLKTFEAHAAKLTNIQFKPTIHDGETDGVLIYVQGRPNSSGGHEGDAVAYFGHNWKKCADAFLSGIQLGRKFSG